MPGLWYRTGTCTLGNQVHSPFISHCSISVEINYRKLVLALSMATIYNFDCICCEGSGVSDGFCGESRLFYRELSRVIVDTQLEGNGLDCLLTGNTVFFVKNVQAVGVIWSAFFPYAGRGTGTAISGYQGVSLKG
jgi:hypothetical protein